MCSERSPVVPLTSSSSMPISLAICLQYTSRATDVQYIVMLTSILQLHAIISVAGDNQMDLHDRVKDTMKTSKKELKIGMR